MTEAGQIDFHYKKSVEKQTGRTEYKQTNDMQKKLAFKKYSC